MVSPMIVGNWKMNTTVATAVALAQAVKKRVGDSAGARVVVCPPFVSLAPVSEALEGSEIGVGAQNFHPAAGGPHTGEVSLEMLAGICSFALVGHSERRTEFYESDALVNAKLMAALDAGITPILCVGESFQEHETGIAGEVVSQQLRSGLMGVGRCSDIVVAYEPIWAVGTGQSARPEDVQAVMRRLRCALSSMFGDRTEDIPLLYGGSVDHLNIGAYLAQHDIDGALVGGASLDANRFCQIISQAGGLPSPHG